jgi:membrane associated rhomboid family serine protease
LLWTNDSFALNSQNSLKFPTALYNIPQLLLPFHSDYNEKDFKNVGTSVNGPMATMFIYNPRKREEAWRFVTYMFVHVGVMHILMNLIVQLFLGTALELGMS